MFGVLSGKLLCRGIEANPEKVKAIEDMSPPQTLKEMQKLAGCVTSLGRIISKLGERALPFIKLMKKKGPFEWTPEADAEFQDLKRYLTSPPVMVTPRPLEPLVLYLAATPYSASAALVAFRKEHQGLEGTRRYHHQRAGQVSLEVLKYQVGLRGPFERALLLHQLEKRQGALPQHGDEAP